MYSRIMVILPVSDEENAAREGAKFTGFADLIIR
jgi:hypothetical protein